MSLRILLSPTGNLTRRWLLGALIIMGLGLFSAGCSDSTDGSGADGSINAEFPTLEDAAGLACSVDSDCIDAFPEILQCEVSICQIDYGVCVLNNVANGTRCTDGLSCTGPDFCVSGQCGGGPKD